MPELHRDADVRQRESPGPGEQRQFVDRGPRAADEAAIAHRGEDSGNALGAVAAGLLGLGIGVGVGLLLAPASGEETRNNIAEKARNLRDQVSSRVGATGTYGM